MEREAQFQRNDKVKDIMTEAADNAKGLYTVQRSCMGGAPLPPLTYEHGMHTPYRVGRGLCVYKAFFRGTIGNAGELTVRLTSRKLI